MDGKGRWPDNAYVEHLWRSLKQEEVYWHAYETVGEAKKGIAATCVASTRNKCLRANIWCRCAAPDPRPHP